ncbi:hypothetical protein KP509_05G094300 [Ceratopteris richardii]|uniref:CCHC-type domain-containing protein n=1 Tax=Ceratopteris richardii TaxID=49495 RepID=A0A8T2V117_CERRI|nr:hypothetical protein KP509_05G094300 [Ceratopteris richardii]
MMLNLKSIKLWPPKSKGGKQKNGKRGIGESCSSFRKSLLIGGPKGKDNHNQMLYAGRGKGRNSRGGSRGKGRGHNNSNYNQNTSEDNKDASNANTQGRGRGRSRGRGGGSYNSHKGITCYHCGKVGQYASDCWLKNGRPNGGNQKNQSNYASTSSEGSKDTLLAMRHEYRSSCEDDKKWYIDSGCSNHMSCQGSLFANLQVPSGKGCVGTGDDTQHMIEHIGDIRLGDTSRAKALSNVLHVPTISKNLISVGQMVEKGYHVIFNENGCSIKNPKEGFKVIA